MTIPGISPADWARMSWHQRDRARRRLWAALEAERCPPRVEPQVVGPYSRLAAVHNPGDATPELAKAAIARIIGILAAELTAAHEEGLAPHGTEAAYRRHQRRNEPPCAECRALHPLQPVSPDEVETIRRLRAAGQSTYAVAATTGRSRRSIRRHTQGDAA